MTIGQTLFTPNGGAPFVSPNVNIGVPSGKISFYGSGSSFSAPISVYMDGGLTALWSQPIQANAAGVLPPIYLDPTASYTNNAFAVKITTASGTLVRQHDPIPIPFLTTVGSKCIKIADPEIGEVIIGSALGISLVVTAPQGGAGLLLVGPNDDRLYGTGSDLPLFAINNSATTGSQTAIFTATNCPSSGTVRPFRWIPILCDGVLYYMCAWGVG